MVVAVTLDITKFNPEPNSVPPLDASYQLMLSPPVPDTEPVSVTAPGPHLDAGVVPGALGLTTAT